MSDFTAQHVEPGPIWDGNTVETALALGNAATEIFTVPSNCYAIWVSANAEHDSPIFMSPDAADVDSGLSFNSSVSKQVGPFSVAPGTVIQFHNSSATSVVANIVQFFNVPA